MLSLTLSAGAAPCEVPLVTQVKVSRGLGAVQLALGLAAHRARADLMVHWHDSEDRDRGERIYIPFEPDHVGLRVHGDYQGVRLTIPDIGSDRVLSLALCFWGQPDEGAEGAPVLLVSHPVLLAGRAADDGISPVVMTGPQAVSTDREVPAEVQWEADLTALPDGLRGPLVLHLGDRDLPLLAPATDGGAALRQTATGIEALSRVPMPVALVLNGRVSRQLWIGPAPLALDLSPELLQTPGSRIELRDPSASVTLARHLGG